MVPMAESDSSIGAGASAAQIWSDALAFTRHAEQIGLQSVWPCDHFLSEPPGGPVEGILEGWTVLSALAAVTDHVELGQMVMCVGYRDPGLLAKMASTAQAVSGGRVTLGVGAGWYDREYRAFGYPIDHRVDRFEEALQIIVPLIRGESVSFGGRYYRTNEAALLPAPSPSIPLLVAAKGPRMMRLTARYADAWNTAWFGAPDDRVRAARRIWMLLCTRKDGSPAASGARWEWSSAIPIERPATRMTRPSPAPWMSLRVPSTPTSRSASTTSLWASNL